MLIKLEAGGSSGRSTYVEINLNDDETGKAPGRVQGAKALVVRR